jgi:hypothetical protein
MKLLSFDVESNGLHGPAFAVAAVLMNDSLKVTDEFIGRAPIRGEVDPWVRENVLPPMQSLPVNYRSARAMRDAFWKWFVAARTGTTHVIVDNPYPVEARFLIACQQDDLKARYFEHPFPLLDLGTMLFRAGADTPSKRQAYKKQALEASGQNVGAPLVHNPRWDAWAAAVTAFYVPGPGKLQ